MRQSIILSIIFLIASYTISAQTIELEGKQTKDKESGTYDLNCVPVKITKSMKITEVEGDCKGFWIEKGSVTIHKFSNFKDAIGTILVPGTYYVFPKLKKDSKKANVIVTLKPLT